MTINEMDMETIALLHLVQMETNLFLLESEKKHSSVKKSGQCHGSGRMGQNEAKAVLEEIC